MLNPFSKVKELQEKLLHIKEELKNLTAHGESGGGAIRVLVNGDRRITSIKINSELVEGYDQEMINDLIIAAVNQALDNVENQYNQEFAARSVNLLPNMPGLDLSQLGR